MECLGNNLDLSFWLVEGTVERWLPGFPWSLTERLRLLLLDGHHKSSQHFSRLDALLLCQDSIDLTAALADAAG